MYVTIGCEKSSELPAEQLEGLTANANETHLKTGAFLFFDGDPADWVFLVKTGVLRMTRVLEDGRRQVIAFGYPGRYRWFSLRRRSSA